jgi:hypothetical protein
MANQSIQIHVLSGPAAGSRLSFSQGPISCGRDSSNPVVLAGPVVSRKHCEIVEIDGRWFVNNLSPNGLRVAGKKAGSKPSPLDEGTVVGVGDLDLFRVHLGPAATMPLPKDESSTDAATDEESKPVVRKPRTRLWVGIGIYMVVLLSLFVYLSTLKEKKKTESPQPAELTRQQIESELRKPVRRAGQVLDERLAQQSLEEARALGARPEARTDGLYRTYRAYRDALAASGKDSFDTGSDQTKYEDIRDRLAEALEKRYRNAYLTLRSQDFKSAVEEFRFVMDMYPDIDSEVFKNAASQRAYAANGLRRSKKSTF